ncbi:Uncharacterised protein [uncultured Flavonifractor sp.]|nr:Uncharacterised protein [uncultured Flavonifractor sp.]
MGCNLLAYFKEKIPHNYKFAFFSTLFIGLLIHLYKFTNTLPNHDSLYNFYSDQNVLGSGRWALSLACGFSSYYDLPWVIGLFSIVFLALTVVVIVALFRIQNPIIIALSGGILASAPATTETFFFLYTADGYMLAMFLAALAVYCSRIGQNRPHQIALSAALICIVCGIYQSYVPFALVLSTIYFIYELFQGDTSLKSCLKWIRNQVILFATALISYYIIWKLLLFLSNTGANHYQGIDEIGHFSIALIINAFIDCIRVPLRYFLQWDILAHGASPYSMLNLLFFVFTIAICIYALVKSTLYRQRGKTILLLLSLVVIPLFSCIWSFVSLDIIHRPMMLQSLSLLYLLCALLFERWAGLKWKNILGILLAIIIVNNALMANISYHYMDLSYERSYADGIEMMLRIHEAQDKSDVKRIAVIGSRRAEVQFFSVDPITQKNTPVSNIHLLVTMLEPNLLFDAEHTVLFLQNIFGLELDALSNAELKDLSQTEPVKNMGLWPAKDSVSVIGDTVVIKLAESEK